MPIRKFFEIPAAGTVLLAAPCEGFGRIGFVDGVNCVVATPDRLAEAIRDLGRDPERAQRIAAAGRRLIYDQHSLSARARQIRACFELILTGSYAGAEWVDGRFLVRTSGVGAGEGRGRSATEARGDVRGPQPVSAEVMRPSTILVTGADGFIGSHLTEALVAPATTCAPSSFTTRSIPGAGSTTAPPTCAASFEVFAGDVRDPGGVREAMQGLRHRAASRGADLDPVLLSFARRYRRHQRQRHAQRRCRRRATWASQRVVRDLDQRGLRHRAIRADHRRASAAGPVALLRRPRSAPTRSRCRFSASFGTPVARAAPVQHLWSAPVGARGHPDDHRHRSLAGARRSSWARCIRPAISRLSPTRCGASSGRAASDAVVGEVINIGSVSRSRSAIPRALIAEAHGRERSRSRPTRPGCGRRTARSSGFSPATDKANELLDWHPLYGGPRRLQARARRDHRLVSRSGEPRPLQADRYNI